MHRWARWGRAVAAVVAVSALAGCGQLFAQQTGSTNLTELSNRVDSLDAQVGELQAALAGGAAGQGAAATEANGVVQSDLPVAVVEADVLNVRSDPSLMGTVKGSLLQNARVNVLKDQGNWSEIVFTNPVTGLTLTGWVDSDYLGPATPATASGATGAAATGAASATASGQGGAAPAAAAAGNSSTLGGAY